MAKGEKRVVRRAKNCRTQVIRAGAKRWSQAAERAFLEELAGTANVRAAAAAAGFSTTTLYRRRSLWPGFAAEWDACLEQGYVRIEAMLIELATDSLRPPGEPIEGDDDPARRMSVAEAMNLLKLHRAAVRGGSAQRYDARARAPDMDAVRASILRKIEAIERADARKKGLGEGSPNPSPEGEGVA